MDGKVGIGKILRCVGNIVFRLLYFILVYSLCTFNFNIITIYCHCNLFCNTLQHIKYTILKYINDIGGSFIKNYLPLGNVVLVSYTRYMVNWQITDIVLTVSPIHHFYDSLFFVWFCTYRFLSMEQLLSNINFIAFLMYADFVKPI